MDKAKDKLLIIFYRNPEPGKVKTRLASTVGHEKALKIYNVLVQHTKDVTKPVDVQKIVFYSEEIIKNDLWLDSRYDKELQSAGELGEKMNHAFLKAFSGGYKKVCIIGTDCLELTTGIIEEAFASLDTHDVVLGPAQDGGYYLLGMKKLYSNFFFGKKWSTASVAADTIADFKSLSLQYKLLPVLKDIDTEDDLPMELKLA